MEDGFSGFSFLRGAWLPPELMEVLPAVETMAELKVMLCALYCSLQRGSDTAISLVEFQQRTGMRASGVLRGIRAAVKRGTLIREPAGASFCYRLAMRGGSYPQEGYQRETPAAAPCMHDLSSSSAQHGLQEGHTCKGPEDHDPDDLVQRIREIGVSRRVAIRMAGEYEPDYLLEKLDQARFALETGLARNGPGWYVRSVCEGWAPPTGYPQRRKEEDPLRYIRGPYAHLIEH